MDGTGAFVHVLVPVADEEVDVPLDEMVDEKLDDDELGEELEAAVVVV